ncbi:MAG: GNAT family N-acetyltransferase [Defluviitaleaceae bacterium]|nr:GNAT family N-acetyltransferase [Defluviitaleaceae bacterium]
MLKGTISPITLAQVPIAAEIIQKTFSTTARDYNYTADDYPTHQGPRVGELLAERFCDDFFPFVYFTPRQQKNLCGGVIPGENSKTAVGFVTLTHRGTGVFEMKFLSVIPEYRGFGIGQQLLDFCKKKAPTLGGRKIIIDIIEENTALKEWYLRNGFIHTRTEVIENHPFTIGYLELNF